MTGPESDTPEVDAADLEHDRARDRKDEVDRLWEAFWELVFEHASRVPRNEASWQDLERRIEAAARAAVRAEESRP